MMMLLLLMVIMLMYLVRPARTDARVFAEPAGDARRQDSQADGDSNARATCDRECSCFVNSRIAHQLQDENNEHASCG